MIAALPSSGFTSRDEEPLLQIRDQQLQKKKDKSGPNEISRYHHVTRQMDCIKQERRFFFIWTAEEGRSRQSPTRQQMTFFKKKRRRILNSVRISREISWRLIQRTQQEKSDGCAGIMHFDPNSSVLAGPKS